MSSGSRDVKPSVSVIPEQWRSEYDVIKVNNKSKQDFIAVHPELLRCISETKTLSFVVYVAQGWELFEVLKPKDFEPDKARELLSFVKAHPRELKICVRTDFFAQYEKLAFAFFDQRFESLVQNTKIIFANSFRIYRDFAKTSQSIFRSRWDDEVYARVALCASNALKNVPSTRDGLSFLAEVVGKDPVLYDHGAVTAFLSLIIGWNICEYTKRDAKLLLQSALIHDVERHCCYLGKTAEKNVYCEKTLHELKVLVESRRCFHEENLKIIAQAKERFDGMGVPLGLKGREEEDAVSGIGRSGRIVNIGCSFSEYMLKRQDKKSMTLEAILDMLSLRAQAGEFDPDMIRSLIADKANHQPRRLDNKKRESGDDEDGDEF